MHRRFLVITAMACALIISIASVVASQVAREAPIQPVPNPSVVVTGLDSDGLEVISPEAPGFDAAVRKAFPGRQGDAVLSLKPYLVILSNHTNEMVVGYAFVWTTRYRDGRTDITTVESKYPDALAGIPNTGAVPDSKSDGGPVQGSTQRVVAEDIELGPSLKDPYWQNQLFAAGRDQEKQLSDITQVEISLDVAIFSDGLLVGPNHSNLDVAFMTYFESKQKLFQQVVSNLDSGEMADQAFAPLIALARPGTNPGDDKSFYETLAAQELVGLRKRIGDSAVHDTFMRAIRTQPFVIRRVVTGSEPSQPSPASP